MYEPQTAKKVYMYRNGTVNKDPKLLVVNDRQVRDFSSFLNRVTSGVRAPVAVRNIYTPKYGHKVHSLEDLVSGSYYVAGGSEQFKRVKYGSGHKLLPRREQRVEVVPPMPHVTLAESRYRRPVEKPFIIHVFRNGDELFHGVRVLLTRRVMASWDHVLETVTVKADLYTPAKKLYSLDGEVVTQVQDGGKYVAVEGGKPFRRVAYCATSTITALRRKRNATLTLPVVTRRWHKAQAGRAHPSLPLPSLSNTMPAVRPQPPPVDPTATLMVPTRRKLRPMAGRKNKEARERALLENRDDSVFGGSPVMGRRPRMPSPPPSASTANLLQGLTHTVGGAGELRGRGQIGIHGNVDKGDTKLLLGGGVADSNEGCVVKIAELEKSPKQEVTISVQERVLTPFPPQIPPTETEDDGERENVHSAVKSPTPTEGVLGDHNGGDHELTDGGDRREIPPEGAQICTPPEMSQNEGAQSNEGVQSDSGGQNEGVQSDSGGQNEGVQSDLGGQKEGVQSNPPTEGGQAEVSGERVESSQQQDNVFTTDSLSESVSVQEPSGGTQEDTIEEENMVGEEEDGEREVEVGEEVPSDQGGERVGEIESQINPDNTLPEKDGEGQLEPEEVPEEVGVAERLEVKEEPEEAEMKVLPEEVELVAEPLQTSVDLTMSRKKNQQLPSETTTDDGGKNLPTQVETPPTNNSEGEESNRRAESGEVTSGDGEGVKEGEATPPPTTDDDEHVLIIEDPPQ